jgi:hypothetical protein
LPGLELTAIADTGTFTTELGLSLVTATVPLAVPAACAVKVTEKGFVCPGDKVRGKVSPLILKPRPVTVACLTVTLVPPELTRATDCVMLAPTFTLPRERAAGEALRWPLTIPMPDIGILKVLVTEDVETLIGVSPSRPRRCLRTNLTLVEPIRERVPLFVPPVVGVKLTLMDTFCRGARTRGRLGPIRANCCPDIAAWVMVRVPNPGLDKVAVAV